MMEMNRHDTEDDEEDAAEHELLNAPNPFGPPGGCDRGPSGMDGSSGGGGLAGLNRSMDIFLEGVRTCTQTSPRERACLYITDVGARRRVVSRTDTPPPPAHLSPHRALTPPSPPPLAAAAAQVDDGMPSHASDSSLSTNMNHSSISSSMSSSEHLPSRMHDMGGYMRRSMAMASQHDQSHMHQPAHPHMDHHNNFADSMQQVRGRRGWGERERDRLGGSVGGRVVRSWCFDAEAREPGRTKKGKERRDPLRGSASMVFGGACCAVLVTPAPGALPVVTHHRWARSTRTLSWASAASRG